MFFQSLNCYNKVSEIYFLYNFEHVLMYIMCKCHVLLLSIHLIFLNCRLLQKLSLKSSKVLQVSCMIYFYHQVGFEHVFKQAQLKYTLLFTHHSPRWQPRGHLCYISYHSFVVLSYDYCY